MRFSLTVDDNGRDRYVRSLRDPDELSSLFASIFWTYTDVRDAAASCRLGMETNQPGHEAFYISAPNILVDLPVEDLLAKYYPGDYPVAAHITGRASPIYCSKAERMLGWKAVYNWEGEKF
jgi:nucleoside-diphosphate-sugar epimerase